MRIFGLTIHRHKSAVAPMTLQGWNAGDSAWTRIYESFAGAWQRNVVYSRETVLTFAAVYACITLIASDISKLPIRLMRKDKYGIWQEEDNPAYSPVLRKPNRYQTRIRFYEQWMFSKLIHGNTYVLKERDNRGIVTSLYVLDPTRVKVKVAPDGSVFYELSQDNLTGSEDVMVPASEIMHDVMTPLYHPLCGVSPITACGHASQMALNAQQSSSKLFANDSRPSGVLTSPVTIPEETAKRLQLEWQQNYAGANYGKVAVLGNGLEYKAMSITAEDAQLIEQLQWGAEQACTAFKVPGYKIGVGPAPTYNNIEALNQEYYSQTLQNPIESIELLMDEGLDLALNLGTEFDLDDLLRMDTSTRVKASQDSLSAGMSPNEARRRYLNLGPVRGGEFPYLQEQNYSLEALAKRDAQADPFSTNAPVPAPIEDDMDTKDAVTRAIARMQRNFDVAGVTA